MKPDVYVVHDRDYPAFVRKAMDYAYESIATPGAFTKNGVIYVPEQTFREFLYYDKEIMLLMHHECGHDWKVENHQHPTTFWAGLRHASKVGYDSRAYTRIFRFKHHAASHEEFKKWRAYWAREWTRGNLAPKAPPETV